MSIDRLSKDIILYGVGNTLYSIVQFITMPIIVKHFSKPEVANLNILITTSVLITSFVNFGLDSALVRYVKDYDDQYKIRSLFSTAIFFLLGSVFCCVGLIIFFKNSFYSLIKFSADENSTFYLFLLWLPLIILSQFFQNWLKYTFKRLLFISNVLLQSSIYLLAILFLFFSKTLILDNVIISLVLGQLFSLIFGIFFSRNMLIWSLNISFLKRMLHYGIPIMIFSVGFSFIISADKYFLLSYVAKEEFAVYSQMFRISAIISMIVSAFNYAFGPYLLELMGKPDSETQLFRVQNLFIFIMWFFGMLFLASGKWLIMLFGNTSYLPGEQFLLFFTLANIFYGLYSFAQSGIIFSKKTYYNIYAISWGLFAMALVNIFFIKWIGAYATASALMVGILVMDIAAYLYSNKYFLLRHNFRAYVLLGISFIVFSVFFVNVLLFNNYLLDAICKSLLVIIITPVLYYFVTEITERKIILVFLKNILNKSD